MRRLGATLSGFAGLLACTAEARGHLVSTELGPFYDGAAHPLVTPGDLLAITVLALLAALGGVETARRTTVALIAAWSAGLVTGFFMHAAGAAALTVPPPAWTGLILIVGVLVAANTRLPARAGCVLAIAVGLLGGQANGLAAGADGLWLSVVGIAAGVGSIALLVAALGVWLDRRGLRTISRIGGSWVAASGLLMLGWWARSAAGS